MSADLYLTDKQEQHIIDTIAKAENQTSAEIRVHIEAKCKGDPLDRSDHVFHELGMDETERQNGVLIYIAAEDHKVAVYGGKGIHSEVPESFWDEVLTLLVGHFKQDDFENGIVKAVVMVGEKLKEIYPYSRGDVNELSNKISYPNDNS